MGERDTRLLLPQPGQECSPLQLQPDQSCVFKNILHELPVIPQQHSCLLEGSQEGEKQLLQPTGNEGTGENQRPNRTQTTCHPGPAQERGRRAVSLEPAKPKVINSTPYACDTFPARLKLKPSSSHCPHSTFWAQLSSLIFHSRLAPIVLQAQTLTSLHCGRGRQEGFTHTRVYAGKARRGPYGTFHYRNPQQRAGSSLLP